MMAYRPPTSEWDFILTTFLRVQDHDDLDGFADLTADDIRTVVDEAARFHQEVLLALSLPGDQQGARLVDGQVMTPDGFVEAWKQYRTAGWPFISVPAELGGGGMPAYLAAIVSELRMATAHAFAMYGAFCYASATMLGELGEPWMRTHVAPRLATGEWTATMCLTEAHAGSDLRQIRTRAIPNDDGTWRITGEKCFISGGDHDLTDNIVHIVLAKVADQEGRYSDSLDSINVFVVPKVRIDTTSGALVGPNAVTVSSLEHKMGIEGSATCTLAFDDAIGWRVSDRNSTGLAESMGPMFFLMNKARVSTAMAGVAYADLSYQAARAYAADRLAGRAPDGPHFPDLPADPIIVHPDIRRLLLSARAFATGGRALALRMSLWQTESEQRDERAKREVVELLTPVMKAYFTDKGFEAAVDCQQVLGGHGYIREYGLEQAVRNARVGQIYEGANGIQARDFVRSATSGEGARSNIFITCVEESLARASAQSQCADLVPALATATEHVRAAVADVLGFGPTDRAAVAYDLLTAFGIVAVAWTWIDLVAAAAQDASDLLPVYETLSRVWVERELPLVGALRERIGHGGGTLARLADDLV